MRRNPTFVLGAVGLSLGLTLAGCSSNDGSEVVSSTSTPALSKDAYVEQANKICADAESQIIELQNNSGGDTGAEVSGDARSELVGQITPIAQRAIDELKTLTPPSADASMIDDGIARMQQTLDTAQSDPTAIIDPIGISGPELNAYGLTSCFSAGPALTTQTEP